VNVKIVPIDWGAARPEWVAMTKMKNLMWSYRLAGNSFDKEQSPCRNHYYPGGELPIFHTPKMTELVDALGPTVDLEKRQALYKQMGQVLYDNIAEIAIVVVDEPYGASKKVESWVPGGKYPANLERIKGSANR
jgi:ABC-type transport system substrate-binding protein